MQGISPEGFQRKWEHCCLWGKSQGDLDDKIVVGETFLSNFYYFAYFESWLL